mgnify:CR=1 FL=1
MYQLTSEVYLDKYNECYKKVIVLQPSPNDDVLKKITKLVNMEKLSPYKDRSPCCSNNSCKYIICNPNNNSKCSCDFLCVKDIHLLFNYLISNGYSVNTDLTKIMQDSDVKIKNLICFISK